jgi:hypothetical protein
MDISSTQRAALADLAERHCLKPIVLFGSHAGGGLSSNAWLDVLDDLRGVFPGQSVDLAVVDRADPLFLDRITRRCVLRAGRCVTFASSDGCVSLVIPLERVTEADRPRVGG